MLPLSSKFSKIILMGILLFSLILSISHVYGEGGSEKSEACTVAKTDEEKELNCNRGPAMSTTAEKSFFLIPEGYIEGCGFKYGQMNMTCIPNYIKYLITIIVEIVGSVCVVMIMMGGIKYIFSGIAEKKEGGKDTIKYAIYGLVISILAWVIVTTLISIITL